MTSNGFKIKCFTCDNEFTFGPNIYDGKHINIYDIDICNNCYISNHDGWSPLHEEKILNHIKNKNMSVPERNTRDLLPIN